MGASEEYELLRRIARGGMSEVFLARRKDTPRAGLVAVKRLHPTLTRERAWVSGLLQEAELLSQLSHPHLVRLLDVGQSGAQVQLVLEYVHGASLAELTRAPGGLPWFWTVRVGIQLAEALEYVHGRQDVQGRALGLVHGDVDPSNVLVSLSGEAKLLDFGVSAGARQRLQKSTGALFVKAEYAAPEVLAPSIPGEPGATAAVDIFSLGVTLYEALAKDHPFRGQTPAESAEAVLSRTPVPLEKRTRGLPRGLSRLVMACLSKSAADRPASVQVVRLGLEEVSRRGPVVGLPEVAAPVEALFPGAGRIQRAAESSAPTHKDGRTAAWDTDQTVPED